MDIFELEHRILKLEMRNRWSIIAAVACEDCYLLHTLDLSNNMLAAVETEPLVEAIMKLQSTTLYDCSLTVTQVCRN